MEYILPLPPLSYGLKFRSNGNVWILRPIIPINQPQFWPLIHSHEIFHAKSRTSEELQAQSLFWIEHTFEDVKLAIGEFDYFLKVFYVSAT